jgi:hypothetical protein
MVGGRRVIARSPDSRVRGTGRTSRDMAVQSCWNS